jgi:hypothetical protein
LLATAEKQELRKVSRWDRQARIAARNAAREVAEGWARDLMEIATEETTREQARLDETWATLLRNDPAIVLPTVNGALEAAHLPARAVSLRGDSLGLIVDAPLLEAMPELKPTLTRSGNPTVGRLNKTERADVHRQAVAGLGIAAARAAAAAAPGVVEIRMVVAPSAEPMVGQVLMAATISTVGLSKADLTKSAWMLVHGLDPSPVVTMRRRTGELQLAGVDSDARYMEIVRADTA